MARFLSLSSHLLGPSRSYRRTTGYCCFCRLRTLRPQRNSSVEISWLMRKSHHRIKRFFNLTSFGQHDFQRATSGDRRLVSLGVNPYMRYIQPNGTWIAWTSNERIGLCRITTILEAKTIDTQNSEGVYTELERTQHHCTCTGPLISTWSMTRSIAFGI
jgi:hypothetical protein